MLGTATALAMKPLATAISSPMSGGGGGGQVLPGGWSAGTSTVPLSTGGPSYAAYRPTMTTMGAPTGSAMQPSQNPTFGRPMAPSYMSPNTGPAAGLMGRADSRATNWNTQQFPWIQQQMARQVYGGQQMGDFQMDQARQQADHFWNTSGRIERGVTEQVGRFSSPEYKREQGGLARAEAQDQLGYAEQARQRDQQRRGINPYSGRAMGDDRAMELNRAAVMESAATKTRLAADQLGLDVGFKALDGMRGNADRAVNATQAGTQAYQQAGNAMNIGYGLDNANFQNVSGAYQGGVNAYNTADRNAQDYNRGLFDSMNDYDVARRNVDLGWGQATNTYNLGRAAENNRYDLGRRELDLGWGRTTNDYNASIYGSRVNAANNARTNSTAQRGQNHNIIGTVLGGALGFLAGGPPGAMAGASIGGAMG